MCDSRVGVQSKGAWLVVSGLHRVSGFGYPQLLFRALLAVILHGVPSRVVQGPQKFLVDAGRSEATSSLGGGAPPSDRF